MANSSLGQGKYEPGHMVLEEQGGTWGITGFCQKDLRANLRGLTQTKCGIILAFKKKAVNDNTQFDMLIKEKKKFMSPRYEGMRERLQEGWCL